MTEELEYVPIDEEEAQWSNRRTRPKWQIIPANIMRYAAPFGRKYYRNRAERKSAAGLPLSIETEIVTQEWVDTVLGWATEKRIDGVKGTRWSFSGFLKVARDAEKYRDWEIRRANATGSGGDTTPDGTDLDALDSHYGP